MLNKYELLELMQHQISELADKTGIDRCAMLLTLHKEVKALYDLLKSEESEQKECDDT